MKIDNLSNESWEFARAIIECIDDGIFITDGEGRVIEANKTALGIQNREEIIGKTMVELIDSGIYSHSASLKVIKTKSKISELQHEETEMLVTAIPYIEDDEIQMIVSCERELKELEIMKKQLELHREKLEDYMSEVSFLRKKLLLDENFVMESKGMRKVAQLVLAASKYDSKVLIEGETGVGKEVVARTIHRIGNRKNAPFIAINCGALPETLLESELFGYEKGAFTGAKAGGKKGYFELADKGVLLLDEIECISSNFQAKLLRVLQENEIMRVGGEKSIKIDVQVIATSNVNLQKEVDENRFRSDLFYRLNTFPIYIPPLRERIKDIVPLVYSFAKRFNEKYGTEKEFSLSSLNALQSYSWPGNVRELENVVERTILTCSDNVISSMHIDNVIGKKLFSIDPENDNVKLRDVLEQVEKEYIFRTMQGCNTLEELENALGISRATLNRKLNKYNLR